MFDYEIKKKILASNENIQIALDLHIKSFKNEENFWKEFIKNQKKNESEVIGGLKPLYFSSSENSLIENEKAKNLKANEQLNRTNININLFNSFRKLGKKFEISEKCQNYSHKNYGLCLNVNEFDFKDKEVKMLNYEEINKKEINNLIENLNDYSIRKMTQITYCNKNLYDIKTKKYNFGLSFNSSTYPRDKPNTTISNEINIIQNNNDVEMRIDNENNNENVDTNIHNLNHDVKANSNNQNYKEHSQNKKNLFIKNQLKEMKQNFVNYKKNPELQNNSKESHEIFLKINESIVKNLKTNLLNIKNEDLKIVEDIKNKHELIKDMFLINNHIRSSSYNDTIKNQKRGLVRQLTIEIESYKNVMKNQRNLSSVVKANLELLNLFLTKVKPNQNIQTN